MEKFANESTSLETKNFNPDLRAEINSKEISSEPKGFNLNERAEISYSEKNQELNNISNPEANNVKRADRTPVDGNGGNWDGERGNSNWVPDDNEVPSNPKTNPDGKTWKDIKDEYGFEKIPFNENKPDFSEVSKGKVQIDDFSDDRDSNFNQADEKLAEQKGCDPEDVYSWRKENKYTWHESSDCKTMQKVPTEVHGNIPHSGGVSEYKNRNIGGVNNVNS